MSRKQRDNEIAAWNAKSAKIDAARLLRGLYEEDGGTDMEEIRTAMTASTEPNSEGPGSIGGTHAGQDTDVAHDEDCPSMPVLPAAIEPDDGHREKLTDTTIPPLPCMVAKFNTSARGDEHSQSQGSFAVRMEETLGHEVLGR